MELFRNSMTASRPAYRRTLTWIIAGVIALGTLAVAAFYYFGAIT
jgi:hypothetical protein